MSRGRWVKFRWYTEIFSQSPCESGIKETLEGEDEVSKNALILAVDSVHQPLQRTFSMKFENGILGERVHLLGCQYTAAPHVSKVWQHPRRCIGFANLVVRLVVAIGEDRPPLEIEFIKIRVDVRTFKNWTQHFPTTFCRY